MLDPQVVLGIAPVRKNGESELLPADVARAAELGRDVVVEDMPPEHMGESLVELAMDAEYDLIILPRVEDEARAGGRIGN